MSSQRKILLFVVIPLLIVLGVVLAYSLRGSSTPISTTDSSERETDPKTTDTKAATWSFDGSKWVASGQASDCSTPLVLQTPVDLTKATAILYPGQVRSQYKPHGGFIFYGAKNTDITVKAPYDAIVTQASRYIEGGEVQYLFEFVNECGLAYRFDHLLTLSPKFQALADTLPEAKADDSRTTKLSPTAVTAGDVIATAVGFTKTSNVSVDFGVYDFRAPNTAAKSENYRTAHQDQASLAYYGVCWLDMLNTADKTTAKSLPGGDSVSGKQSDYCSSN